MDFANVYITNHHNNRVALPISPEEIKLNYETNDSSDTIIGLGQINQVGDKKLRKVTISSFLPLDNDSVTYTTVKKSERWRKANSYINFLKNIVADKKPCRLVVTGSMNLSMLATLTFTYGYEDGKSQEYQYELDFTEYKPFKAKRIRRKRLTRHGKRRAKPLHHISRGSKVVVNGTVYHSRNAKSGRRVHRVKAVIEMFNKHDKHRYYLKNIDGSRLGWTNRSDIRKA